MNLSKIKNLKFNNIDIKIILGNVIGAVILLIFTNLTISYSKGNFEIPIIDRTQNNNVSIGYNLAPHPESITETEEPTEEITNVQVVINPDSLIEATTAPTASAVLPAIEPATEPAQVFELYSDAVKQQGFNVSDGVYELYNAEKTNAAISEYKSAVSTALANGGDAQNMPPKPVLYEYKFVKITPEAPVMKIRNAMDSVKQISKPAVEPFMDYLIIRDEKLNDTLCDASGKIIMSNFTASGWEILKMRTQDEYNRTVFKYNGAYYVYAPYIDANGLKISFSYVNFDELLGNRGVPFMYPSYYGADGAENLNRNHVTLDRWGYKSADKGLQMIRAIFNKTFNFSEQIGIAYLDSGGRGNKLYFLNKNGYDLLAALGEEYFAPSESETTSGSLGYFYFDHGLTRAYRRDFDMTIMGYVQKEVMIELKRDANGYVYFKEFYVPEDYNVKAYSNGVILLEKDGWYGFMNYLGEWIAQPIYKYAQPFYEGVAVIGLENGKKALIDTNGNLVVKFKYDLISNCTGGIVALYEKTEGWTILNKVRRQINVD